MSDNMAKTFRAFILRNEAKMATIIIVAAVLGFALLFSATLILVILNWGEKTYSPVFSILLVGTATMLAAVLVSLKSASIESAFTTSVVIDTTQGVPPLFILDPHNVKLTSRLNDLSMLGQPAVNVDGKTVVTIQKPSTEDERFRFCAELLQYQLLLSIEKMQRGSTMAGYLFGASTASVSKPMRLSDKVDYPGRTFLTAVAENRFSNSDVQKSRWDHGHMPLPRDTIVNLIHLPSSSVTGTEKFIVQLEKPLFFKIQFVIEPIAGTGLGTLPNGLTMDPQLAGRCQTYQFQITMNAEFRWITAGNSRTQEYKDWASWLYSGISNEVGD
jgi:hypothetical protein